MKDGETVVIGGLLKEVKTKGYIGVPILSKIPLLGTFFRRETVDNSKVDLLIFITAHVVKEGDSTPEDIDKIQTNMGFPPSAAKNKAVKPVSKKK
jgi:protein transport protein HofQ